MKTALLQRSDCLKAAQHPDHSVVFAGVRNGVDVRTGADRGCIGIGPDPAREGIANGILTHRQTRCFAPRDEPRTCPEVRGSENDSSDRGRFGIGNRAQLFDLLHQTLLVNGEAHVVFPPVDAGSSLCR